MTRPPEAHHEAYATTGDYAAFVAYADELEDTIKRLGETIDSALDLNRQMWGEDEDNDSPGNLQHAILLHGRDIADASERQRS